MPGLPAAAGAPFRAMPTYAIDPLHPDRLRCQLCGATVAALPDEGEARPAR